jgi:hypothetical protein
MATLQRQFSKLKGGFDRDVCWSLFFFLVGKSKCQVKEAKRDWEMSKEFFFREEQDNRFWCNMLMTLHCQLGKMRKTYVM